MSLIFMPVQQAVVALVAVAEQAVVTGGLAPLGDARGVLEVLTGVWVEVADRQRLAGDLGELSSGSSSSRRRTPAPPSADSNSNNSRAKLLGRERLGGKLLLLQLEYGLDPALQRRLERGHLLVRRAPRSVSKSRQLR